jgi:hypothetical protein
MKYLLIQILTHLFLFSINAYSQAVIKETDNEIFFFRVKQIEEFIDRFNNQDSNINVILQNEVSRRRMIASLFDQEKDWNEDLVKEFIIKITEPEKEQFLNFENEKWYAEVDCNFKYKVRNHKVKLILQIEAYEGRQFKWVIKGVDAGFLLSEKENKVENFINPAGHGTGFIRLKPAMSKKESYTSLLSDRFKEDPLTQFFTCLRFGIIEFVEVDSVTFHFLQLNDWAFVVKEFNRPEKNSGWLIADLQKLDKKGMEQYEKDKLFLY